MAYNGLQWYHTRIMPPTTTRHARLEKTGPGNFRMNPFTYRTGLSELFPVRIARRSIDTNRHYVWSRALSPTDNVIILIENIIKPHTTGPSAPNFTVNWSLFSERLQAPLCGRIIKIL